MVRSSHRRPRRLRRILAVTTLGLVMAIIGGGPARAATASPGPATVAPAARSTPSAATAARTAPAATTKYTYSCGEPPFQGYDGPNNIFTPACNYHDRCYWGGTHGYPFMGNRYQCDTTFRGLMYAACWRYQWWNASCYATAELYYNIVRNVGMFYWAGNWWDNV